MILLFSTIVCGFGQTSDEFVKRGFDKYCKEDFIGAVADFGYALNINPKNEDAFFYRAMSKNNLKDFRGSLSDINEAIKINPDLGAYYLIRADAKNKLRDFNGAIDDYNKTIELEPIRLARAYYERGLLRIHFNQKESGCIDLSKAGELGWEESYKAIKQFCQ